MDFNSLIGSASAFVFPFHSLSALVCLELASPGAREFYARNREQRASQERGCLSLKPQGLLWRFPPRSFCQLDVSVRLHASSVIMVSPYEVYVKIR